ncbi:MAG: CDP-glycerol glycerophosphotransferase family protein [Eubacterium sp.]|nr:CDP-glycerol glycerophosphotransferase family protein [Eubacterium sp.]
MKVLLFSILKFGLKVLYAPLKLFKTKNRVVYLSRQSNDKSLDMSLLERAISENNPDAQQVFRLRMIPEDISSKIKYCLAVVGDMYYLATSKVAILDTYSITVSCLKHKKDLKVIQMWHALGAIKKFGLQSIGTKEGRDEKISSAMCMHKNYDYVLAPSKASARFYMDAFGCSADKIKICSLPRVDEILKNDGVSVKFFRENPALTGKKIVLYLPTFRDRERTAVQLLKTQFLQDMEDYHLIVSTHPLFSKVKIDREFSYNGTYSTIDLMKVADVIVTDYSACAFEAALLMKPLYFFVPDYELYIKDRGVNIDLKAEMPDAVFEDAEELCKSIKSGGYDQNTLFAFKTKYIQNTNNNNTQTLAKFISMIIK